MDTIDILKHKVLQVTKEFNFLLQENKELKQKLNKLQEQNDILTRKSEDLILTINNRLKKEEEFKR